MENKHLILLVIIALIFIGIFIFQFNNNVSTFITINESEVSENGTISGILVDSFGWGVGNQIITYHKTGDQNNTTYNVSTDNDGKFIIKNVQYYPEKGENNYYTDFKFSGDGKYQECVYESNVKVNQL